MSVKTAQDTYGKTINVNTAVLSAEGVEKAIMHITNEQGSVLYHGKYLSGDKYDELIENISL